jgi:hypothetical protein
VEIQYQLEHMLLHFLKFQILKLLIHLIFHKILKLNHLILCYNFFLNNLQIDLIFHLIVNMLIFHH